MLLSVQYLLYKGIHTKGESIMVNETTFRQVLGQWASGVTVVTTADAEGWKGVTVSSFSSVSLLPPLVSICVATNLYTHDVIQQTGIFAVNILNTEQIEMGKVFAGLYSEIEDRFAGLTCEVAATGAPILPNVLGWVDCKVWQAYPGGDHTIFVGEVQAVGMTEGEPLLYFKRQWGEFSPI